MKRSPALSTVIRTNGDRAILLLAGVPLTGNSGDDVSYGMDWSGGAVPVLATERMVGRGSRVRLRLLQGCLVAAVLARPWVDTVLSGAATVGQLESNLAAVNVRWDATLEEEFACLAEGPESYWQTRSALPWS